jgi:hypothetical protein
MTAERVGALAACALVAAGVIAGCSLIGSPQHARAQSFDRRRSEDLGLLAQRLRFRYADSSGASRSRRLPATLPRDLGAVRSDGSDATRDPATGAVYRYLRDDARRFRLCATFALAGDGTIDPVVGFERHPAGPSCFRLDVLEAGLPGDAVPDR